MSSPNQIKEWMDDNVDYSDYDDAEQLYFDVSERFEDDNRLPLDEILKEDRKEVIDYIQDQIDNAKEIERDEEIQEELETEEPEGVISRIGNFIKSLFRF